MALIQQCLTHSMLQQLGVAAPCSAPLCASAWAFATDNHPRTASQEAEARSRRAGTPNRRLVRLVAAAALAPGSRPVAPRRALCVTAWTPTTTG